MARYWLSFTLDEATVGNRTYNARYKALYDTIHEISGTDYWEKTTSFIVFDTNKTIDQVTALVKKAVSPTYDLVLIRSLDVKAARIFGPNTNNNIFKLMPYLEKA